MYQRIVVGAVDTEAAKLAIAEAVEIAAEVVDLLPSQIPEDIAVS